MSNKIKVLVIEPGKKPSAKVIDNTLEAKQQIVEGYIEIACPPIHPDEAVIICNEEGKLQGLSLNRPLRLEDGSVYDMIAGTFIVLSAPINSEDFEGLTDGQIEFYTRLYA